MCLFLLDCTRLTEISALKVTLFQCSFFFHEKKSLLRFFFGSGTNTLKNLVLFCLFQSQNLAQKSVLNISNVERRWLELEQ